MGGRRRAGHHRPFRARGQLGFRAGECRPGMARHAGWPRTRDGARCARLHCADTRTVAEHAHRVALSRNPGTTPDGDPVRAGVADRRRRATAWWGMLARRAWLAYGRETPPGSYIKRRPLGPGIVRTKEFISSSFCIRSRRVVLLRTWSTDTCTARHSERTEQSTERVQMACWPEWLSQKSLSNSLPPSAPITSPITM